MWFHIVQPMMVSKAFKIAIPVSFSRGVTNVTEQLWKVSVSRPVESSFYFGPTHPWRYTNLGCQSFQFRCSLWALLSRDPRALRLITFARTAWPALNGQKSCSQLFSVCPTSCPWMNWGSNITHSSGNVWEYQVSASHSLLYFCGPVNESAFH